MISWFVEWVTYSTLSYNRLIIVTYITYITCATTETLWTSSVTDCCMLVKCKCKVYVYSPDIPVGSADCIGYTPGIGTHSFTVSSPLGRIQHLASLLQL